MEGGSVVLLALAALLLVLAALVVGAVIISRRSRQKQQTQPQPQTQQQQQAAPQTQAAPGGVNTNASFHLDFSVNACSMTPDATGMNTAMSAKLAAALGVPKPGPGSAVCGRRLRVTNADSGKSTTVKVLDLRSDDLGLDLQKTAFDAIDDGRGHAAGKFSNLLVAFE